jgi:RNA polymerase sigma-70 factor (ECF subfamily)
MVASMDGSAPPTLAEVFLRERPGQPPPRDLEARLQAVVARGRDAWPELGFDPIHLVGRLAIVVGADVETELAELHAEDFALGIACLERRTGALAALDRVCGGAVTAAIARIDRSRELHDEVRQILWQRLFVGTPEQAPRILSYAGRGPLAAWIAVAAQRIALDLRRDAVRNMGSEPEMESVLYAPDHPEVDYLRTRYRGEFEQAVRAALAALPDRDRLLLRLTAVSGLSHEQVAAVYGVNQSTVSRWIAKVRAQVLKATADEFCGKLGVPEAEFRTLADMFMSQIDLSISRVLAASVD